MSKQDELGCLWEKQSDRGSYMTGKIGDVSVVAFKNDHKKNPKEPDWRILKSRPRVTDAPTLDAHDAQRPAVGDDSIPF